MGMKAVQNGNGRRSESSSNGDRRSDGTDMVQPGDSGTRLEPDVTMQRVGCDDTQHSAEAAPQDVHDMFRTTDGKSTSRMMQNKGVDAISDARSEGMFANQETNEGHQAEEDDDTSGSSVAEEDAATNDSADSDDSKSSRMTEFLEEKRPNKRGVMVRRNEWFSGAWCACATGMRRGFMCGQSNPHGQHGGGEGSNICLGCRPVREDNGDLKPGICECECDACHIDGDDPCGCPECMDNKGEKCYCSTSEDDM